MRDLVKPTSPIQHLKNIEVKHRSAASPSMPIKYIVATKYEDRTANGLTKCIIHWLKYSKWQAERISNTGQRLNDKWVKGTGRNGTADISATIRGRSVKIEVKIGADRQSQAQKDYQDEIEQSGGVYLIAKDFQSFYNWYFGFLKS